MKIFQKFQPEYLIALLKDFKKAIDGTGTTTVSGRINYVCTILRREVLREFENMESQKNGTNNTHLKAIQEGLIIYPPPPQLILKKEVCDDPCYTETLRGAFQEIFSKTPQAQQLPTVVPWVIRDQ